MVGGQKSAAQYTNAEVVSIYKRGRPQDLGNCVPLSLLTVMCKGYAVVTKWGLMRALDGSLQETEFGFRPSRNTSQPAGSELSRTKRGARQCHVFGSFRPGEA